MARATMLNTTFCLFELCLSIRRKKNENNAYNKIKIYSCLKLKYICNYYSFSSKNPQSNINFSLSSNKVSSTSMNSLKDESFLPSQPTRASLGQFFVIIINLSKLVMLSLVRCKFMINLTKLNIHSVTNWDPIIPRIYLANNATCRNWASCVAHHIKGFSQSLGFTCKHWNILNSFLNKECSASSFE